MKRDEPLPRRDIADRMARLTTEYTRRERVQDAVVEGVWRIMRGTAWLLRHMGRLRPR